jgi:hypothetical protein
MGDFEAAARPGRSRNVLQWGQEINLAKEGLLQTHTARSATDNGGLGGSGGVLVVEPRGGSCQHIIKRVTGRSCQHTGRRRTKVGSIGQTHSYAATNS